VLASWFLGMDSERPPPSSQDATREIARGTLRETLGALRNLSQLLHSLRVAPKSLSSVLPDVLDALVPMRTSANSWLASLGPDLRVEPAQLALSQFIFPHIDELEAALRESTTRPMNAKSRLALEDVVSRCSFELDAARELLQLLEDAVFARSVRLDPRELVREAFTAPPSARAEGRALVSATLSSHDSGQEIEINPRVVMMLVALGVELVGARPGRETPHVLVTSDGVSTAHIRITRRAYVTGEPLVLASRGVVAPTLACLQAAAALTHGKLEWSQDREEFSLSYALAEPTTQGKSA
jgi:hypothetical protein